MHCITDVVELTSYVTLTGYGCRVPYTNCRQTTEKYISR